MVRKSNDPDNSRESMKSADYRHFPIRLFGICDDEKIFDEVVMSAMFMFAENLRRSPSERMSDEQLLHAFHADVLDVPPWCDTCNDDHFYLFCALKTAGCELSPKNFDFDLEKQKYESFADGSRIVAIHKSIFDSFKNDNRINSKFDFRIYCAIKAMLGRDKPYRYIPSIWIRYGYWGGTARDTEFRNQLPSKSKTLKSISRLVKRGLIHKFTDHNRSYFSKKMTADEIMNRVAMVKAKKEHIEERLPDSEKFAALKDKYKAQLIAKDIATTSSQVRLH